MDLPFQEALAHGETPEPVPEFGNPILHEHLEKVANITTERLDVVLAVIQGMLAVLNRQSELLQKLIEERRANS